MASQEKKYQKIPNFYRPEAQSVFALDDVVALEKIDGTNFSFGVDSKGFPTMNSRNNVMWIDKGHPAGPAHVIQFDGFNAVGRFLELHEEAFEKLKKSGRKMIIFGEFYGQGIQKRIQYSEDKRFAFYDAFDIDTLKWLDWADFKAFAEFLNLPLVPELYIGPPKLSVFEKLVKEKSTQAKLNGIEEEQISEGIVIKGLVGEKDKWGERLIIKYKSDEFSEKKGTNKKKVDPEKVKKGMEQRAYAIELAEAYVTQGRLDNCLEKMRGESLPMDLTIMREVIKYMQNDVFEDVSDEEKDHPHYNQVSLYKQIGTHSAMLYKQYLKDEAMKGMK